MEVPNNEELRGSPPIYIADNSLFGVDQLVLNNHCHHMVKGVVIPRGLITDRVEKMVYLEHLDDLPVMEGRPVLIVDEILESGRTLSEVVHVLESRTKAKSIGIATLMQIRRPEAQPPALVLANFVGFSVPLEWYVGGGIDFNDKLRGLTHVCALSEGAKSDLAVPISPSVATEISQKSVENNASEKTINKEQCA